MSVYTTHYIVSNFHAEIKMKILHNMMKILPFTRTKFGFYYRYKMQNAIWKILLLGNLSSRIRLDAPVSAGSDLTIQYFRTRSKFSC